MMRHSGFQTVWLVSALLVFLLPVHRSWALSGEQVVQLTRAGLSPQTIASIRQMRVIETGAFAFDDLMSMASAGLSDETIATILRAGAFPNRPATIVYGRSVEPLQLHDIDDVLRLKAAGVDEKVIRALLISASDRFEQYQRQQALDLLKHMSIRIDQR